MTENICAISTPEQRKYLEIREPAERAMLNKVFNAIDDAAAEVADAFAKGPRVRADQSRLFYVRDPAGSVRASVRW